jgi:hypothetical protein
VYDRLMESVAIMRNHTTQEEVHDALRLLGDAVSRIPTVHLELVGPDPWRLPSIYNDNDRCTRCKSHSPRTANT